MDRILRKAELLNVTGLSSATLYRWINAGMFPAPKQLGPNSVGWLESAVQEWIDSREPALGTSEASPPGSETHHNGASGSES